MPLPHTEMLLRIAVGALLGGIIGFERDRHQRPVGLRTHLIVSLTAATFMVVSTQFAYYQQYVAGGFIEVDTSRIAASVVSAIGFLAGGAILRNGLSVRGLTTAAGLWLVTAIGMCAGGGMYIEAVVVTAMGMAALTVLRRLEDKDDHLVRRRLDVMLTSSESLEKVFAALASLGVKVSDVAYDHRLDDEKKRVGVTLDVEFRDTLSVPQLVRAVEVVPGVRRIQLQSRV